MLIEFKTSNFKAFEEETVFNMKPKSGIKDIEYSVLNENVSKKEVKSLCSSVIYGANAAGKSSIIHAMSCLKQIILRGNILDLDENRFDDYVSSNMSLIPFAYANEIKPICFDITFVYNQMKYRYILEFEVGLFLDTTFNRKITLEKLYINDVLIFERTYNKIIMKNHTSIQTYLLEGFDEKLAKQNIQIAQANISDTSLFLTGDFSSYISKKIVGSIRYWFDKMFVVVNRSNEKSLTPKFELRDNVAVVTRDMNDIAKVAGIVGSDFAYVHSNEDNSTKLISIMSKKEHSVQGIPSEVVESVGTLRLIGMMPFVIQVMKTGGTLIMDELDASIHPMIIMNIIGMFHNDEINTHKAQLIFNTHNPIYLNHSIFRRDEIKFVERDKESKKSILYALSDFNTNGKVCVRNTSDYMKNYFINRYGAIEDVDFSDIFKKMLSDGTLRNEN